jgi:hypothetical protein
MSVDLRTRTDGLRETVEAATFFADELPARIASTADLVAPGTRWLDPRPLTIDVADDPWTVTADDGRVSVHHGGEEGAARVRLSDEQLDGLVHDQQSFMGMWSSGQLDQPAGRLTDALDWWLVLRGVLDGVPVYTPGSISFSDHDGAPLDLQRTFHVDDDRAEMRHFLEEAGFLHLAGVFGTDEMAAVSADMDRAAPTYEAGDGRSWWAKTRDGTSHLVRMQGFDRESDATAELLEDRRFRDLGDLPGDGHEFGAKRTDNRIEALFKPIGIVEGISDVPWHKDCSLGRHSYECCSLTVGISVTGADAVSGQLRVRPGSHRALVWPALEQPGCDLPTVDLPTETGDVTMHLSCTLHMAQPPVERERRVMYTGFSLPAADPGAAAEARAKLRAVREAAPVTVSQPPSSTT